MGLFDSDRACGLLEQIAVQLTRISCALERLSPVIPPGPDRPRYIANLSDLHVASTDKADKIRSEVQKFADATNTVLYSDAFWSAMIDAEEDAARNFGEEFIDKLPWNRYGRIVSNREGLKKTLARTKGQRQAEPADQGVKQAAEEKG